MMNPPVQARDEVESIWSTMAAGTIKKTARAG